MSENKNNKSDNSVTKIYSLDDFIKKIEELTKGYKKERKEVFFRGHSNYTYTNKAFIFREGNLLDYEDKLFNDTVVENHAEFIYDPTVLEKLVKMQHFSMPTRMMDISSSPYVGLYFACNAHADMDGEVVIFAVPEHDIKYYNSDKVAILSNLCKLSSGQKINSDELHHLIQEERMNFPDNDIEYKDLNTVLCVKTKKNNDRIIKQEGAFFLFGLSLYEAQKKINQKWLLSERVLIAKEAKKDILDELKKKGFDWNTLFPDEKRIYEELWKYINALVTNRDSCKNQNILDSAISQLIDITTLVIMRSLCVESIDKNCDERLNILKDIQKHLQNDDKNIQAWDSFKRNSNISDCIGKIEAYIRRLEKNPYLSYSENNKVVIDTAVIDNLNTAINAIERFIKGRSSRYSGELKKILDTISEKLVELQSSETKEPTLQNLQSLSKIIFVLPIHRNIIHILFKVLNSCDEKYDTLLSTEDAKHILKDYIRILAANADNDEKVKEYIKKIDALDSEASEEEKDKRIEAFKNEFSALLDSLVKNIKNAILQENVIILLTNNFNEVTKLLEKAQLLNNVEVTIIKDVNALSHEDIEKLRNFLTEQKTSLTKDRNTSSNDKTENKPYADFALLDEYLRIINEKLLEKLKETKKILQELFDCFLKELSAPLAEELKSIGEILKNTAYGLANTSTYPCKQKFIDINTIGNKLIELSGEMKNTKEVFRYNLTKIKKRYQSEIAFR